MINIIDVSGYSFSGKGAIRDFLMDKLKFYYFPREFEFDLIRVKGGIFDLSNNIIDKDWSLIRSSESIREFKQLIKNIGRKRNIYTRFNSIGTYYDDIIPNFKEISDCYLESLIEFKNSGYWPFYSMRKENKFLFLKKIINKLGYLQDDEIYYSKLDKKSFELKTFSYFNKLFNFIDKKKYKYLILDNAFENKNPQSFFKYFSNAKSIIIDRDPRDIYLSAITLKDRNHYNTSSLTGSNVLEFIKRFKFSRDIKIKPHKNVKRINFEFFINEHSKCISILSDFLDIELKNNLCSKSIFDLNKSKLNIRKWEDTKYLIYQKDIKLIEDNLTDYLIS